MRGGLYANLLLVMIFNNCTSNILTMEPSSKAQSKEHLEYHVKLLLTNIYIVMTDKSIR